MRDLSKRVPIRGRGYSLVSQACGPLSCYMYALVCETTKDAAVIDPSFVNPTEFQALTDLLEKKGANLKHVLLTHGHPDHVIGVDELMNAWPEASLHLHPMEDENYRRSREMGFEFGLRLPDTPLPIPTHELQDGGVVTIGDSIELSVVHTPGHSPGHVSFIDQRCFKEPMKDGNNNITNNHNKPVSVMISGDLLFQGGVGRTDFHNSSLDDLYARWVFLLD